MQKHADNLGIRLKNDPYYQEICNDVYDILLDACPYNCCFRVVAQTHHKRGFGLSVWIYCEQFYELSGLLNGILEVMAYFSLETARLEHQNMLTGEPIVFPQLTESEAA